MSRIVAGTHKGHHLTMPSHDRTRPTSDRVRESAFNLMAAWAGTSGESGETQLKGFSFLDLYAGSGAVALEAASRGASPVVAVEKDPGTAAVARRNGRDLGLDVTVAASSVEAFLAGREPSPFDVVWLDPPYAVSNESVEADVAMIASRGWLAADGLVVLERSARDPRPTWPDSFVNTWGRSYGETVLYLGSREDA